MARKVNRSELEQKKAFIINESIKLITEIGYKSFSVNQVIKKCGISKGSFFHHFENKEALIEGITEKLGDLILTDYDSVMEDDHKTAKEMIRDLFEIGYKIKMESDFPMENFVKILYLPENNELYNKLMYKGMASFISYIEKIIESGCETGEFNISHPKGVSKHFVRLVMALNQNIGRVLYDDKSDFESFKVLQEEALAFEEVARLLFGFDEHVELYGGVHKLIEMKMEVAYE